MSGRVPALVLGLAVVAGLAAVGFSALFGAAGGVVRHAFHSARG